MKMRRTSKTEAELKRDIRRAVRAYYGPRCRAYTPLCPCCQAWKHADALTGDNPKWPNEVWRKPASKKKKRVKR